MGLFVIFITTVSCVSSPMEDVEIRHEIRITNEGSRSEGEWGVIMINDYELPSYFSHVIAENVEYIFITREFLWSRGGYWPTETVSSASHHSGIISQEELSLGWYEGDSNSYKKGTPNSWIWISGDTGKDEDFSYWVNPLEIESFIDSFFLTQDSEGTAGYLPAVPSRLQK